MAFPKDTRQYHNKSIIIKNLNTSSEDKDVYVGFGQKLKLNDSRHDNFGLNKKKSANK